MINPRNQPYRHLPFQFHRLNKNCVLITNLVGEYLFLSEEDFNKLILFGLENKSDLYFRLMAKHFIAEELSDSIIELLSIKYRTKKNFLTNFTALHMFVVTLRCNHQCVYCHASSKDLDDKCDMNKETAKKAVDIALESPSNVIKIEFQGGEPLLNFEIIKFIVEYATTIGPQKNKRIEFVICTNLTLVNEEILQYFCEKEIHLSISLDGPRFVHNRNRSYRNGMQSYEDVIAGLKKTKIHFSPGHVSALMTTTKYSLNYYKEIIDEYIQNGFSSIFLRSLNPFGYAREKIDAIGYSSREFLNFYKKGFMYILEQNQKGIYIEEALASILLTRILTPYSNGFMDLQFPAGAGISGAIYDHNGNVYPSDEARMLANMGDTHFCLGNVRENNFREIFYNDRLKNLVSSTCAEVLPGCSDCVFQIYCGIDPIRNYLSRKDIVGYRPTDDLCFIYSGIMKFLFELIERNEPAIMDVIWSWVTRRNINEIRLS